jgi:hypothetical protein
MMEGLRHRLGSALLSDEYLYDWQRPGQDCVRAAPSLSPEAVAYLHHGNPCLQALQARYDAMSACVTTPLAWTPKFIRAQDLQAFRGDNAYVWQVRGAFLNPMAYALTMYYVRAHDTLGLLELLEEDGAYGACTFTIDGKVVSRDLLDSILEIYFLDRHLKVSRHPNLRVLDIGAGYGRLAHRMVAALPNVTRYCCTDAVALSTFLSEYYLKVRQVEDRAVVAPLDTIESTLSTHPVDLAINIHSWSECTVAAIDWWVSLLAAHQVRHVMIVPNAGAHGGERLLTNDRQDMEAILTRHGYRLVAKEPKYLDPLVQRYAVNPTYYYLFALA